MRMTVDTRDLRALERTLRQYVDVSTKPLPAALELQATQMAIGKGGLYREGMKERGRQVAKIKALPQRLGHRIRKRTVSSLGGSRIPQNPRRRGASQKVRAAAAKTGRQHVTEAEEIRLRLRHAGRYQASGWINRRMTPRGAKIITSRGRVSFRGGINPSVTLTNTSPQAAEYGARTGYIGRALRNRTRDMLVYIQRKLDRDARAFSRPRPRQSARAEISHIRRQIGAILRAA